MSSHKYYLGIDGGGSKTAFVVIDENENIVFESVGKPTSIDTVSLAECEDVINSMCNQIPYKVDAIFAGLGGMNRKKDIDDVNDILRKQSILKENGKVNSGSDVINALYGALNNQDGIILIAGTGSVAFGKNKDQYARSGGYCYQEGDGGSAYYLGYKALQYLARALDGRKKENEFTEELKQAINYVDFSSMVDAFKKSRTEIASLAKIVTKYQHIEEVYEIIKDGVYEVLEMIKAVHSRLNFKQKCKFSIIGSLANADSEYKNLLLYGLKQISPYIIYIEKIHEASFGAALKAKEL